MKKLLIIALTFLSINCYAQFDQFNNLTTGFKVDTNRFDDTSQKYQIGNYYKLLNSDYYQGYTDGDTLNFDYTLKERGHDVIVIILNKECHIYYKAIPLYGIKGHVEVNVFDFPEGTYYAVMLVDGNQENSMPISIHNRKNEHYNEKSININGYRIKIIRGDYSLKYIGIKNL